MTELTFIIITYNSAKIIDFALSKINTDKYNIIIVDNGSSDATLKIIKAKYPNILLIENKQNIGFARANNLGFKQVKTEFFALLNPDCILDESSILKLIKVIKSENNIALAGAEAFGANINDNLEISNINPDNIAIKNYLKEDKLYFTTKFISGCFMLGKTAIFKEIGLFNAGFFLYCEDNELCKRVKKNNYEIIVVKATQQIHFSRKSVAQKSNKLVKAINWHKYGYSKCYYTECVHNRFIAKLRALRNIIKLLIILIFRIMSFKKLNNKEIAIISGSFAYLIGQSAFTKNGNPRKF